MRPPVGLAQPIRRLLLCLALALSVVVVSPAGGASLPDVVGPPNPPPIVAQFHFVPSSVQVGSTVTYQGFCGQAVTRITPVIWAEGEPIPVHFFDDVTLKPTPFWTFSVQETIPAVTNRGFVLVPGIYFAGVTCVGNGIPGLPLVSFEITAGTRQ